MSTGDDSNSTITWRQRRANPIESERQLAAEPIRLLTLRTVIDGPC